MERVGDMLKNVVTSAITTLVVIIFAMVGLDTFITDKAENNLNTDIKKISYETDSNTELNYVYEEGNSVVSISGVVGVASKKNNGNRLAQALDNTWSVGSGCILDSKGYIITNQHVLGNEKNEIYNE